LILAVILQVEFLALATRKYFFGKCHNPGNNSPSLRTQEKHTELADEDKLAFQVLLSH
jgi:hypothetical protein